MIKYLFAVGLMAAGCGDWKPLPNTSPNPADYRKIGGIINFPKNSRNHNPGYWNYREAIVFDTDGDCKADVIETFEYQEGMLSNGGWHFSRTDYVAPTYTQKEQEYNPPKTMTPELRAAATKALRAQQDLALLIDQYEWKLRQEKVQKQ